MTRVLLTGAGGFVGSHTLEHILATTGWDVVATDSFRHKGKADRLAGVLDARPEWQRRLRVVAHDLAAPFTAQTAERLGPVDYVIAMASESHVDRSITDPVPFVLNNVSVALNTLEFCRQARPRAVVLISTDEVYGPEPVEGGVPVPHAEWAPILPSNPYSASKAAQEAIAISYWRTYGVPLVIVNCMNMIGERQDPEKFLPMLIQRISAGEEVTIHGREGDIGTRHYLHARNLADGLVYILENLPPAMFPAHEQMLIKFREKLSKAEVQELRQRWSEVAAHGRSMVLPGSPVIQRTRPVADRPDRYNVVGPDRIGNLDLARQVASIIGKPLRYRLVDFHSARPGHDPHYGLDPAKLTAAGWKPPVPFAESLERTIRWTLSHPEWLRA